MKWIAAILFPFLITACGHTVGSFAPAQAGERTALAAHINGVTTVVGNGLADITWYNNALYEFHISSVNSQNKNEFVSPCYNLGPLSRSQPTTKGTATLYAIFVPGATMHRCPDQTQIHDHLIDAIPGSSGYHPLFTLVVVVPGPNFTQSIVPLTSVAALGAAVAAGQVLTVPTGVTVKASVVGIPVR